MIRIAHNLFIFENDIRETFVRSSGPGGQNVNKVSTTVQLRFDVTGNQSLPEPVKKRLLKLGGSRTTRDGSLIITASNHRSRERNREEARRKLLSLIRQAAQKPKVHKKTKVPRQSRIQRLENKKKRGKLKSTRHRVSISEP